jgi:hypothetical protein
VVIPVIVSGLLQGAHVRTVRNGSTLVAMFGESKSQHHNNRESAPYFNTEVRTRYPPKTAKTHSRTLREPKDGDSDDGNRRAPCPALLLCPHQPPTVARRAPTRATSLPPIRGRGGAAAATVQLSTQPATVWSVPTNPAAVNPCPTTLDVPTNPVPPPTLLRPI